jgi:hypothetical protein
MIDERDPAVALQAAMFTACSGSAALQAVAAGGVRIFDRVSASVFPFVRIGEDMVDADDSACGSVSEVFSTVRAYSRRPGLVEVKRLAAVLQDLLDMRTGSLEVDGFRVVVGYCDGISFERHADGLTTQAVVNFRYRLAPVPTSKALEGAGLLDELIGTASASVAIKATAAATLGDLVGAGAIAGLPLPAELVGAGLLGELTGSASAVLLISATGDVTLGELVGAGGFDVAAYLVGAGTLGELTGSASAAVKVKATAAATLGDLVGAGVIGSLAGFSAAATLGELTGSASAAVKVKATAAGSLGDLVGAASAALKVKAAASATLGELTGAASAAAAIQATAAATLGDLTGAASAAVKVKASAAATLGELTGSADIGALVGVELVGAGTLGELTGSASAAVKVKASAAATLGDLVGAASAAAAIQATAAGTLGDLTGAASAAVKVKATAAATLGDLVGAASAAAAIQATAAGTLGDLTGAASAAVKVKATAAATLGDLVGAASAAAAIQATAAGTLGDLTGAASAAVKVKATAAATLGDLVGAGSITAVAAGPTFESGVIHAWNPDAGADASGIIADAVGSANMWARDDLSAATSWSGELAGEALVVDHADVTDFKIAAATLTFWMYENGGSPAYSPLVHLSNTGGPSTGDWRMSRNGATSDQQNYVYTGYDAGANGKNPRECPTGQWNLWTIRLGAGTWRVLGNSAVQLSSTSWVTASFAGNTRPLSLGSNEDISDHTGGVYSDFRGRFGDVRMWDKSLSDAEIAALYTAGRQSY